MAWVSAGAGLLDGGVEQDGTRGRLGCVRGPGLRPHADFVVRPHGWSASRTRTWCRARDVAAALRR
ncbi:hypothetical protein [Lentzea sp. NPDC055074]